MRERSIADLLGVPPPATEGRERLIAAGIELFYRHGFQSVGIDRVMQHAGVTKTTFYKHFESKDDFVLACVRERDAWEMQAWAKATRDIAGDDPRGQLLAFFDVLDVWFNDESFRGCLFINTAAEFSDPRDPVHKAAAKHKKDTRDHFKELADRAGARDPGALADEITLLIEGTLILRHVHGRNDAARIAKPIAQGIIDRAMAAEPSA